MPERLRLATAALLAALALPVHAEFRTVGPQAAVLYDAPSAKARKVYIVGPAYPLEVLVNLEHWSKVRDRNGDVAWAEKAALAGARTVMVAVPTGDVRSAAQDDAPLAFQAVEGVLLEFVEYAGDGWIKVRHRDRAEGYIRVEQVWGA